jgi:hypothetical protein
MTAKSETPPARSNGSGGGFFGIGLILMIVVVAGAFYYVRRAPAHVAPPPATEAAASTADPMASMSHGATESAADMQSDAPAPTTTLAEWPADLPPLPLDPAQTAQPPDTVRSAYLFAAQHPEVLNYVPCFCGCQLDGHHSNEDCFVGSRDANGRITSWEHHGTICGVCLNVAHDAARMYAGGASVAAIRTAIERKYKSVYPNETPTPAPPKGPEEF